jgi:hypothetical protein
MRNARLIVMFGFAALVLGACNKQQPAQDQNIAIDSDVPNNVVGNADIETLPPDESSVTPSNQLENGFDNPDLNDVGNTTANSY